MGKRKHEETEGVDAEEVAAAVRTDAEGKKKKKKKSRKSTDDAPEVTIEPQATPEIIEKKKKKKKDKSEAEERNSSAAEEEEPVAEETAVSKKDKKKKKKKSKEVDSDTEDSQTKRQESEVKEEEEAEPVTGKEKKKNKRKKEEKAEDSSDVEEEVAAAEPGSPKKKKKKSKKQKDAQEKESEEEAIPAPNEVPAAPIEDSAWTAAEFDDANRKAKFLKLMGGEKAAADKPVLSLNSKKAHRPSLAQRLGAASKTSTLTLKANPEAPKTTQKSGSKAVVTHLDLAKKAVGKSATDKMNTALENQFTTALHMRQQIKQGRGLGFSNKKFEIDSGAVRSRQF